MAASVRATTSSGVSMWGSVWSITPRPSVLSFGKSLEDADPAGVGGGKLHGEPLNVHVAERADDEVVGPFRAVLPVEVGVAEMHAQGHILKSGYRAIHRRNGQLYLVVDVGYALFLAVVGIDEEAEPRVVDLDHVNPQRGEAEQFLVDDGSAGLDELLASRVRPGRVVGAPHAPPTV